MATFDQRNQVVGTQYNISQGISEDQYRRLTEELGVTRAALTSFFKMLEQQQVPPEDLDHTLRQIATSYKDLQIKLQSFISDNPAIVALKSQARDAVEALGPQHPDVAHNLNNLAMLYQAQGRYGEAMPLLQRALTIHEQSLGPTHPDIAMSLNNLATLYRDLLRYAEAEPLYQRALALYERVRGPDHPEVDVVRKNYIGLLRATDRHEEAEQLETRVRTQTGQTSPPRAGSL
jgi:tetratricopeptide (TPR) repeat protein